jgi:two-component system, cell cycle sensor histidine kinase and response regulator CckA
MKPEKNTVPRWMKAALALAVLALLAGAAWFYHSQEQAVRQSVEKRLASIARLKADHIATWRRERLADAAVLMESPFLHQGVARFLSDPRSEDAEELRMRFRGLQVHYNYADVLLADPGGRVRLSMSGRMEAHRGYASALAVALRDRKPVLTDLYAKTQHPTTLISAVAPLFARNGQTQRPLGAIILVSDASLFLYPLIQSWPIPSQTEETLLVRRDGNDVLFLNDLRHQPDTALKLRIPLSRTDVPAVMAVLGKEGFVESRDYRGVEVVSVVLPIPDSPWFMVAKMDAAEAFAEWRFRSGLILALLSVLMGGLGTIGFVAWQREKRTHYQALYRSEAAMRASVERHSVTLRALGDGVIAADAEGRVEFLNPAAEALTGWGNEEARGRQMEEVFRIVSEETREKVDDPVAKMLRDGLIVSLANHTLLIAKDGVERPIADSGAPIRNEQGAITGAVLVFRDQSEERRAQRLIRARLALLEYANAHTLDEFLTKALDETGALAESPIGFYHFVDANRKTLSLQQWSTRTLKEFCRAEGKGMHYGIDQAGVWADGVREARPVVHNDYASLPNKKGMPQGHAAVFRELVVPVMREGMAVAILGVGNKPVDYTEKDVETVAYLADVTWHIVEKKRMEEALEEERRRLQQALDEVKTLRGIVPICANCKKIRDDKGYWNQVEKFVSDHTEAKFSHGICPDCAKKLYPELYEKGH